MLRLQANAPVRKSSSRFRRRKKKADTTITIDIDAKSDRSATYAAERDDDDSDSASEKELLLLKHRQSARKASAASARKLRQSSGAASPPTATFALSFSPTHGEPAATEGALSKSLDTEPLRHHVTRAGAQYDSSLQLSEEFTPQLTSASSNECVGLRKLSRRSGGDEAPTSTPSAFKVVTPVSSQPNTRPSSRGSSKGLQVSANAFSDEPIA